jgi:protein-S-isoprenylcysteine O-methyltransferase Ste14
MNRIRLVPPVYFLLALGLVVLLDRFVPVVRLLPPPWHWLGLLLLLPAAATGGPGARALLRRGTTLHPFGEPTTLVTDGPYRFSRNPLYLSLALLLLGAAIYFGSLTSFLVIPVFVWAVNRSFIRPEEARLATVFGDSYRDYCHRVRRWL